MVFQQAVQEDVQDGTSASKVLTPGPYKATRLWNGIVQGFRADMQCKRHRRHLKTHSSCFTSSEAIDFLQKLLKENPNIGKEVTRQQTIQLLRKFLKNHVIEDVQGRWGTENFEDDGKLFRFPPGVTIDQQLRCPLGTIDGNVPKNTSKLQKKNKRKSKGPLEMDFENKDMMPQEKKVHSENDDVSDMRSSSASSWGRLKRSVPQVATIPKCRVISPKVTEEDIQEVWKKIVLDKLKSALKVNSLEEVMVESAVKGDHIRQNATRIGKSGIVQVEKKDDIPYWALSAMTCLANWPDNTDAGLPCYPGFEKDVFKAITEYFCGLEPVSMQNYGTSKKRSRVSHKATPPNAQLEPLLTYEHYELFTNVICLIQPGMEHEATKALHYALLLLPPTNRRKLHLLVRLMSRMCRNSHLEKIGGSLDVRTLVLQTFSKVIMSCNEEVYLNDLLAMRLVSFLIDHHCEVLKAPSDIEKLVEERLAQMRRPEIRYDEKCEEIPHMHYVLAANQGTKVRLRNKSRAAHADRQKRKSADLMKSWDKLVTSLKSRPLSHVPSTSSQEKLEPLENDTRLRMKLRSKKSKGAISESPHPARRLRTRTVSSRCDVASDNIGTSTRNLNVRFDPLHEEDVNESRIKAAKSCSDICDIKPQTKLNGKSSEMGSLWNIRMLGNPFSRLRKGKF